MNIYLIEDISLANNILQLSKLNAECVKTHWSTFAKDIPTNVIDALGTIEEYAVNKRAEIGGEPMYSLSESEEEAMLAVIKKEAAIREILGGGVIFRGTQSEEVLKVLNNYDNLDKVKEALKSGKIVAIF